MPSALECRALKALIPDCDAQPALIQIKPYGLDVSPIGLDIEPILISIRPHLEVVGPEELNVGPSVVEVSSEIPHLYRCPMKSHSGCHSLASLQ